MGRRPSHPHHPVAANTPGFPAAAAGKGAVMNLVLPQKAPEEGLGQIIKLAIMAVGGQGGGVLTGWIESLARAQGYACQATSVAGVAQRTGATIYYIEMTPASEREPV